MWHHSQISKRVELSLWQNLLQGLRIVLSFTACDNSYSEIRTVVVVFHHLKNSVKISSCSREPNIVSRLWVYLHTPSTGIRWTLCQINLKLWNYILLWINYASTLVYDKKQGSVNWRSGLLSRSWQQRSIAMLQLGAFPRVASRNSYTYHPPSLHPPLP